MRLFFLVTLTMLLMLAFTGTAMAAWPNGGQGDQYNPVNTAMQTAVAGVGLPPDTFIAIYDSALAGDTSGYSDTQLAAACEVLSGLSSYKAVLTDYDTVSSQLGCGTRLASAGPTRSSLPSTGIALALIGGSSLVGLGAASRLLKRNRD